MRKGILHIGSVIGLRPEFEERYIILHRHPFPEVLRRIRKSNIRNYSIFLSDDLLFSHLDYVGRDHTRDTRQIGADPTTREWWKLTDPMQKPLRGRKKGEWWARLGLMHHSSGALRTSAHIRRVCYSATYRRTRDAELRSILERVIARLDGNAVRYVLVFTGFGRVFLYVECGRNGLSNVPAMLNATHGDSGRRESTRKVLTSPWKEMKMVFYTA